MASLTQPGGTSSAAPIGRGDAAGAVACAMVGLLMATLPHLVWWHRLGEPVWIADFDDMVYLKIGAQAYDNHPTRLADPAVARGERSLYPGMVILPGVMAARAIGLGEIGLGLAWRAWGGITVGLASYLLLRHFSRRPIVAAALAAVLLADAGLLSSQVLVKPCLLAARLFMGAEGTLFETYPRIHPGWRIFNPALTLPLLLLHAWAVATARARPDRQNVALAGVSFGVLFSVYFYYYTAAALALGLAFLVDARHRRLHLLTLAIGLLVGLPGLVGSYTLSRTTPSDWLARTDKFVRIGHFSELMIPKALILVLAVGLLWVWVRRRDLMHIGLLALSGLVLANHQIVTGLQIENFHWHYVWGPMGSWLVVLLAAGGIERLLDRRPRQAAAAIVALSSLLVANGLWLRGVEATRTAESRQLLEDYRRYVDDRREADGYRLVPNGVIGGDPTFVDFAMILDNQRPLIDYTVLVSPYIDDRSWDERTSLNALLLGRDAGRFEAEQRAWLTRSHWGPWSRDAVLRDQLLARRLAAFRAIAADPASALERCRLRAVALPAGQSPPEFLARSGWARSANGRSWDLWTSPDPEQGPSTAPATESPDRFAPVVPLAGSSWMDPGGDLIEASVDEPSPGTCTGDPARLDPAGREG